MTGTRRITYEGSGAAIRELVRILEAEGVTVVVRRERRPPRPDADWRGMTETVTATLWATGTSQAIRAAVQTFGRRFPGRAYVEIDGEDDDPLK